MRAFLVLLSIALIAAQTPCNERWECSTVTSDFNFVNCVGNQCQCLDNSNFAGSATTANPCRCEAPNYVQWSNNKPYCLKPTQCLAGGADACSAYSENAFFVECPSTGTTVSQCRCRNGFQGSATLNNKCRCQGTVTWENNVPSCTSATKGVSVPPLDAAGENTISFKRTDGNLPWPITRSDEVGNLVMHGPHCLDTVSALKGRAVTPIDRMHLEHCQTFLGKVKDLVVARPDIIKFPVDVCDDLIGAHTTQFGYRFAYDEVIVVIDVNWKREDDNAIWQGMAAKSHNQNELLERASGNNMGNVLMKGHAGLPLPSAEWEYINSWQSERAVRLGACGIACSVGPDCVAAITSALA